MYITYGGPVGQPPPPPGAPRGAKILTFANRFVMFTANGKVMRTVKLTGIHQPWGIAVDGNNNVYMTATEGLVKVSPAGRVVGQWSTVVPPTGKYVLPSQPAVDQQGNAYATNGPGDIVKISASGHLLGTIVKHGAGLSAVQKSEGLTVINGHLFVGDAGPNRIKEFSTSGILLAIWTP